MGKYEKFTVPDGSYPEGRLPYVADSDIPEFLSLDSDLVRYAYGGKPDDLDKLKNGLGIISILAAILVLRKENIIFKDANRNSLVKLLYEIIHAASVTINGTTHESWPEFTVEFLLEVGFEPAEIRAALSLIADIWLTPALKQDFNRAAALFNMLPIYPDDEV